MAAAAWKYFKIKNEDSSKALCLLCDAELSRGNPEKGPKFYTTSNLRHHLRRKHAEEYTKAESEKSLNPKKRRGVNTFQSPGKGEDGKCETSQSAINAATQLFLGDMSTGSGEVQTPCDDVTVPLSPEQFLSEDSDPARSSTSPAALPQRPESYKLRHNNHLNLVLESLAGDESFMDVTLTAQGRSIKAHKSVLSAVSPYFKGVLKENPCQHPIIIMPRDIRFEELNNIVSYVYKGEMTVATDDLPSLLKTAEVLQVTGLTPPETGSSPGSFMTQIHSSSFPLMTNTPNSSKSSKKTAKKQSIPLSQDHLQPNWYNEGSGPTSACSDGRIDPQDFLTADMTCVKEEVNSDDETERPQQETQPDHNTVDTPPLMMDTTTSQESNLDDSSLSISTSFASKPDVPGTSVRPFRPGENSDDLGTPENSLLDNFVCPYCNETHRPLNAIQSHLRLKHPSKPSFLCQCGLVFLRQAHLTDHSHHCESS